MPVKKNAGALTRTRNAIPHPKTVDMKTRPKRKPAVKFPKSKIAKRKGLPNFAAALDLHMRRHGDTAAHLHRAVARPDEKFSLSAIKQWRSGRCAPRWNTSLAVLARIERRYKLPTGYFSSKLHIDPYKIIKFRLK